ncbi:efflux RND transporter periplasmic adaptor subunit [Nitrobacter winogradskyi]|uniref:RND transporter n=2 Tax=Nitrobacter winogradskyi TaxID=913 RepID=A0A4Y3WB44_NITWI|nr:efflux RND transporter periplasmic adaptor subunit [Nitrobacter winogradskyi]MCP1999490.1 membrane fusion protein (multidrug efflux system) [Nitrobacter winogradskyi]GEC16154.1 RND transporter [Nitrobacter winogradskyi]
MPRFNLRLAFLAIVIAGLSPLLGGCDEPTTADASAVAVVPEVSVITVVPKPHAIVRELPGRISPLRVAEVRPRVSGIITKRLFQQGSEVKAGDPLYQIDPEPFAVEVQAAEAALAKADAVLEQASHHARRIEKLTARHATSEAENEKAIANMRQAAADVAARKADLARARLHLDYTTIRAPIDGVVGAAQVTEGALVVQNDAASLATVQQLNTIYADFTQSVTELNNLRHAFESGDLERIAPGAAKVRLLLNDEKLYPLHGKFLFSEAKVDSSTGQVTLRGEFANPKRELLPGMYIRVLLEQGVDSDAIAVPQQAVQRDSSGGSEVFVVRDDDRAIVRPIRTDAVQHGYSMVSDGLNAGDRVVVEGFQKFTAGDKVRVVTWEADASPKTGVVSGETASARQ